MVIKTVDKFKVVDLFPYKIKDVDLFLFRDHDKHQYHPTLQKSKYKKHWSQEWRRVIEGNWVQDTHPKTGESTWVYMMPKLYWYVNYATIELQGKYTGHRPKGHPLLRDNEWIIFTYLFCCQGFSGFEDDDKYTCNFAVEKILKSDNTNSWDYEQMTPDCFLPGTEEHQRRDKSRLKKFVNPWEYLRHTYLLDDPRGRPLGKPLYFNQAHNLCLLGCRTIGKTLSLGPGDCLHEFLTNGIKYYDDLPGLNDTKVEIFVGASDSNYLENFLSKTGEAYRNLPGAYDMGKFVRPSPFYRYTEGTFSVKMRSPIVQLRPIKSGNDKTGSGSKISKGVFTKNNPQASVGQRPVRIYDDEFGLQENALEVHGANDAALKADGWKHGIAVYTGTSGNLEKVKEAQEIFENPIRFDVFAIPNYWEDETKLQGLFVPQQYALKRFKDPNGNTDIIAATEFILQERKEKGLEDGELSIKILNEPLSPREMFLSRGSNIFPQDHIIRRIERLKAGLWEAKAHIGTLEFVGRDRHSVRFVRDSALKPINEYTIPKKRREREGAFVIYEFPRLYGEGGANNSHIYKVAYDPVADDEEGPSLASVIVYKGVPDVPDGMYDTIVAEWCGRLHSLEDMHDIAIKAAIFYSTKLLYEANVSGIGSYLRTENRLTLLRYTPYAAIEEVVQRPSKKIKLGGVKIPTQVKRSYINIANQHARQVYTVDKEDKAWITVDRMYSYRLLYEMNFYNPKDNFDHLSAWILIMLMIKEDALKGTKTTTTKEEKKKDYDEIMEYVNSRLNG